MMLDIRILVDALPGKAIGVKEDLDMVLEKYGDVCTVSVTEVTPEQTRIGGT